MTKPAPTRYCHPCKAAGVKTAAYQTNTGLNGRARVNGVMANVCPMHRDALTVLRAEVAGNGHDMRQAWETNVFDADLAIKAADKVEALVADRDEAVQFLTQTHLTGMLRRAGTESNAMLADAMFNTYFDESVKRIGNALFNGETLTPEYVNVIVWTACKSNTSERKRTQDARLDMPVGDGGDTLHSVVGEHAADTNPLAWRVGGAVVGATGEGLAVSTADFADMLASTPRPADITPAEWNDLLVNYLG